MSMPIQPSNPYLYNGGNQSVIRSDLYGNLIYRGASRRSYKDPRNPIKGEMRAFSRALLYSHPVEI